MIDPTTGRFELQGGSIEPSTTCTQFLSSPPSAGAVRDEAPASPWSSYDLPLQVIDGLRWGCALTFEGEKLKMCVLWNLVPDERALSWDDGSEEKEMDRKARHDAWAAASLGAPPYRYPWGKVESYYDARGGASKVVISYT